MVKMEWRSKGLYESLFIGCQTESVCDIWPSKSKKWWTYGLDIPVILQTKRSYADKAELQRTIELAVAEWFAFATMDHPATDRPFVSKEVMD